jgi:hypothetical protein
LPSIFVVTPLSARTVPNDFASLSSVITAPPAA